MFRDLLHRAPKTYWFGGLTLGFTIRALMIAFWDPSEYLIYSLATGFPFVIVLLGMGAVSGSGFVAKHLNLNCYELSVVGFHASIDDVNAYWR